MRRIVIIDQIETPNYLAYFGCGLGNEIYTVQYLQELEEDKLKQVLSLGSGDAAMLVGAEPFRYLRQFYHFGIRGENYFDCAKLHRLSIEGGAYVKEIIDFPDQKTIDDFLSPEFTRKIDFPGFKYKVIHDWEGALRFLDWCDSLPLDTDFGFDYEASGMPMEKVFAVSGYAISTEKYAGFVSLTDIRHQVGEDSKEYREVLDRTAKLLVKRQKHMWTYNLQYEYQVSHRLLGVDLYDLCDASVVNVLDGNHEKHFSLKFTAQFVLGVDVWDSDFDRLSELIEHMILEEVGKLKRDKHFVVKITPDTFENTPEWKEICARYPEYVDEFRALILEYWGNQFMPIPSEIFGKYCCLDSFYTLMIYLKKKPEYTQEAFEVFMDNLRLGARLMSHGHYIDENYRLKYDKYCRQMMAWSITWNTRALCWLKMEKHKAKATNIKRYKDIAIKLLEEGNFFQGNSVEIVKYLLSTNIDTMDTTETGLNEGQIKMKYGEKFADQFVQLVKDAMVEVKMKGKIDEGIVRKKKILGVLAENAKHLLGLDQLKYDDNGKINSKHIELEKYMYYKKVYEELERINNRQLKDVNNIPDTIYIFGQKMEILEYANYLQDNYFQCLSPEKNDKIVYDMMMNQQLPGLRAKTAFLGAILESTQQLPETDKFYSSRNITDINVGFAEMMKEWETYWKNVDSDGMIHWHSSLYPDKVFNIAMELYRSPKTSSKVSTKGVKATLYEVADKVKDIWTDFAGFNCQTQFFPEYAKDYENYESPFDPVLDLSDEFYFMRKFTINYLVFKKHAKMLSVYAGEDGMFNKRAKYVIEDEHHIPIRDADPDEPGAVKKNFTPYEVLMKSSKRWSSSFHTIISHGDIKNCLVPAPSWDENGDIVYGGADQLLTYFDISSAEVKAAGYASGDPDLISRFNDGTDIYIYSAKLYLGDEGWGKLTKKQQKTWRKRFKTIFLGVLYGLGKQSLAERLDASVEEAEDIIQGLYKSFPQLRHYVDSQGQYPLDHDGYIRTMLGDKLRLREYYDYLPKAKNDREKNNLIARIKRLGVNLPIQGGTSTIMAHGFDNNIRVSIKEGWSQPLQPIITVHDSNTNLIPVEHIFDILAFYQKNYTDYCAQCGPKIRLLFDLLVGFGYESACPLKQIDENTIEFSGPASNIILIYDKIMKCKHIKVECNKTREEIMDSRKMITDPYYRTILESGCSIEKDTSDIKVQFHKLG